jgi:hypothetical protein
VNYGNDVKTLRFFRRAWKLLLWKIMVSVWNSVAAQSVHVPWNGMHAWENYANLVNWGVVEMEHQWKKLLQLGMLCIFCWIRLCFRDPELLIPFTKDVGDILCVLHLSMELWQSVSVDWIWKVCCWIFRCANIKINTWKFCDFGDYQIWVPKGGNSHKNNMVIWNRYIWQR